MPERSRQQRLRRFLGDLADPDRPAIDASTILLIVAHPDDETIACGGIMHRLRGVRILVVTDGAPADLAEARRAGFSGQQDYADARRTELLEAAALGGVGAERIECLGLVDQMAALSLVPLALRIASRLGGIRVVMTHAFEGGHPDHDATAFAVHAAVRMNAAAAPDIVEMPFYHASVEGWVRQRFISGDGVTVTLNERERVLKRQMLACHGSQSATLGCFADDAEHFRAAPDYDFTRLPGGVPVLYERYPWGLDFPTWTRLVRAADNALELDASA
jgi:LmbE family N-acetylglucosaminyl deacetylase